MKRIFAAALCLLCLLAGCAQATEAPKGNFVYDLPEGFEITDVTDTSCSIAEGDTVVGGIQTTPLKPRTVEKDKAEDVMRYLQEVFHKTNDVEYISMFFKEPVPALYINLTRNNDAGEREPFRHRVFVKDGVVYHLWLDMAAIEEEQADLLDPAISK